MRYAILMTGMLVSLSCISAQERTTYQYLFMGHPRDDQPGEIVQPEVERVDYSAYDLLLLGGDYTWRGTGTRETVDYLEEIFTLSAPRTLAALGNHDTQNRSFFTDKTGRTAFYTHVQNGIAFVVLDTTDSGKNITGAELTMLEETIDGLSSETHMVLIHHHFVWMADYPPLAHLQGSPLIGASSNRLSGLNFHAEVYPLLVEAKAKGVEVLCLGGDRTGSDTEEFYLDHITDDGIRFIGAGLKEELDADLRTVVVLEHDISKGTLTPIFKHLTDLPRIPDEPIAFTEVHYNPAPGQGNDHAFIELYHQGADDYDLSGAAFTRGIDFTFPEDTVIRPGEFLVVAADATHYFDLGVNVFDFAGTSKPTDGEPIVLRDRKGLLIDSLHYRSSDEWPSSPDNTGPSLSLVSLSLDGSDPEHWAASDENGGTPGRFNFREAIPSGVAWQAGAVELRWSNVDAGASYQLEYSETLAPEDWQMIGEAVVADGSVLATVDSESDCPRGFYRLRRKF